MAEKLTQSELDQFCGTENYYQHWAGWMQYTDGVKFLAEKAGAYWLLDVIASYRMEQPFQVWELKVNPDKTAVVTMVEDTGKKVLVCQRFKHTDFPLDNIKLWLIKQPELDAILILPSEY